MIFFKQNKRIIGHMFEEGKNNLLSFYSHNLKPLLFQTRISEEDVFNFALYRSLPLDKEKNKVLFISNDQPGNQIFEIKPATYNPNTQNYNTFIQYLGMNKIEKAKSDTDKNKLIKELQSVLANDCPVSFLYWIDNITAYNQSVQNIHVTPLGSINHCWEWSVKNK